MCDFEVVGHIEMWGSSGRAAGDDVDGHCWGRRASTGTGGKAGWRDGEAPLPPFSGCGLEVCHFEYARIREPSGCRVVFGLNVDEQSTTHAICMDGIHRQAGSIRMNSECCSTARHPSSAVQKTYGDQLMLKPAIADCAPCNLRWIINARPYVPCQTAAGVPGHCPASYLADPDAVRTYPAYGRCVPICGNCAKCSCARAPLRW